MPGHAHFALVAVQVGLHRHIAAHDLILRPAGAHGDDAAEHLIQKRLELILKKITYWN